VPVYDISDVDAIQIEYFPVWYREHALPNLKPHLWQSLEALNSEHNIGSMRFEIPASEPRINVSTAPILNLCGVLEHHGRGTISAIWEQTYGSTATSVC
jgi:hypothetical protein